ncbi:MAG: hypothetical protein ACLUFV_07410 [Acutalibacteraceae bacterium]
MPIDPAFVKKIIGDEPQVTAARRRAQTRNGRAARVKDVAKNDEDVLSYALFDQVALKFFESRKIKELVSSPAKYYVNIHEIK